MDETSSRQRWEMEAELGEMDLDPEDLQPSVPLKRVPAGDLFEAARAGDLDRLRYLLDSGVNVNARDPWDSVALYYSCLAGHVDAARMLLEAGAICSERTFDGDRCHYAALNLRVRRLLKAFEARPPPLAPLPAALRDTFLACAANRRAYIEQCEAGAGSAACAAELVHQRYAEYKSLKDVDNSQKRFILQGLSLPEQDRLPFALHRILQVSLANSCGQNMDSVDRHEIQMSQPSNDLADVCIKVGRRIYRCHQVILASRSEYFRARLSRMTDFLDGNNELSSFTLPFLEEHDLSTEAFEKMIEYM
ncbi:hypothetical protein GW17_00038805 [Ensete ventricosum]|uniref:Uncharacterized protein n=1 Tax=Ensete ventricosum TaxID=4639 RepID=A0A444DJS7_ENSVE|nr:hypothetical protein B296_00018985 [Ensete ventricosum]RWV98355.1 hypothetical protein GW17_00038805 [Ensete ventricosum]RZR76341.1 hypothetical protein BHM03_00001050 [Ensete ventricosum]